MASFPPVRTSARDGRELSDPVQCACRPHDLFQSPVPSEIEPAPPLLSAPLRGRLGRGSRRVSRAAPTFPLRRRRRARSPASSSRRAARVHGSAPSPLPRLRRRYEPRHAAAEPRRESRCQSVASHGMSFGASHGVSQGLSRGISPDAGSGSSAWTMTGDCRGPPEPWSEVRPAGRSGRDRAVAGAAARVCHEEPQGRAGQARTGASRAK